MKKIVYIIEINLYERDKVKKTLEFEIKKDGTYFKIKNDDLHKMLKICVEGGVPHLYIKEVDL